MFKSISLAALMLFVALLMFSSPVYATSQCPPELGPKDPLVDVLGWLVFAVSITVSSLLFAYLIRRSRGMRYLPRSAVIALGFAGMMFVWVGGFVLAFLYFFLRC
jgi:hypothetical protein